jgi:hypothetical protein
MVNVGAHRDLTWQRRELVVAHVAVISMVRMISDSWNTYNWPSDTSMPISDGIAPENLLFSSEMSDIGVRPISVGKVPINALSFSNLH